jgi:hypothetical protein
MGLYAEQTIAKQGMIPQTSILFGTIVSVNEGEKLLKIVIEPWGIETGWCRVLKDTFYTILNHDPHDEHLPSGPKHSHSAHEIKWPYKVGQEVLAAAIIGSQGSEQYVVLGLLE